jgi:hypothetical protein
MVAVAPLNRQTRPRIEVNDGPTGAVRGALTLLVNLYARARFFLTLNSCFSAQTKALYLNSDQSRSEPAFEGLIGDVSLTFCARDLHRNLEQRGRLGQKGDSGHKRDQQAKIAC